jgi:hypothetical protein
MNLMHSRESNIWKRNVQRIIFDVFPNFECRPSSETEAERRAFHQLIWVLCRHSFTRILGTPMSQNFSGLQNSLPLTTSAD